MQKALRITFTIIASLILLIIIGGIALVTLVNPNDFKPQITQKVEQYTGRKLSLNGDLQWSFFPWLGIQVNNAELSNAAGFGNQPFVKVAHADVQIKLIPLLSGKIELGKLTLDKFELNLITNNTGNTNWQDIAKSKKSDDSTDDEIKQKQGSTNKLLAMGIMGLNITDGHIRWINQVKHQSYDINHLQIKTNNIKFNLPFSTDIQFNLQSNEPKLNTDIKLSGDVTLALNEKRYLLKDIQLSNQINDSKYPQGKLNIDTRAESIEVNLADKTLNIKQLKVNIANLNLNGNLFGKNITNNLLINGQLNMPKFNLGQLLALLDKHAKPNNKLNNVAASFQLQATSNSVKLTNIQGHLNDSQINGSFAINDFTNKTMIFNAAIDQLDLGHFSDNKKPLQTAASEFFVNNAIAANNETILPVDTLRNLNAQGHLKIDRLKTAKFSFSNFAMQLNASNGLVNISNITAKLFQGIYDGNISIDTRATTPHITTNNTFKQIQIEPLLNSLADSNKAIKLAGTGNFNANLTMQGNTKSAFIRTLNGKGNLQISQGVIKGIDIPYWVAAGKALAHKQQTSQPNTKQTSFDSLTANFTAINGTISNNDLLLHAQGMRITGNGNLNLSSEQINYMITGQPLNPGTNKPQGFAVPLKITGTFSNVNVFPAVDQLVKEMAREKMSEKFNDVIDKKLGKGVGEELQKRLNLDALFK